MKRKDRLQIMDRLENVESRLNNVANRMYKDRLNNVAEKMFEDTADGKNYDIELAIVASGVRERSTDIDRKRSEDREILGKLKHLKVSLDGIYTQLQGQQKDTTYLWEVDGSAVILGQAIRFLEARETPETLWGKIVECCNQGCLPL